MSPSASRVALLALGASTAVLQTLAVREGMAVASGNEAVVAILFGVWMLETALGAYWGRRRSVSPHRVALALAAYGVALVGTLVVARSSTILLPLGEVPSLLGVGVATTVLLAPACMLSGWVYGLLARLSARADTDEGTASARAYWLDTLGAGVSGAVLALFALDHALPFQIAGIACGVAVLGASRLLSRGKNLALALGSLAAILLIVAPIDRFTYRWHAPGQTILEVHTSPRGALLVTELQGQRQILLQRETILVPSDEEHGEQAAHIVAALHERPRRVLVLGVPPGNFLRNLLAHHTEHVEVVTGDELMASLVLAHAPGARHDNVTVKGDDERAWVRSAAPESFDIIFIHAGAPTSVAEARLFSTTFYQGIAKLLAPDGLVAVTMPGFAAYASESERVLHGTVASTLRTSFPHVAPLPADRTLYLASSTPAIDPPTVAPRIVSKLRSRGIETAFVTESWLSDRLSPERVEQAGRWSARQLPPSTDAHPVVFRAALQATLARLGGSGTSLLAVAAISLLLFVATWMTPRSRPVSFSVATTGFAGLASQLVLMLVYQTAVGALYRDVALVTAAYMGASCVGTLLAMRRDATMRAVLATDGMQLGVVVAIALSVSTMAEWGGLAARVGVVLGAVFVGVSTGAQFAMASRVRGVFGAGVGASVYGIDLLGAAIAAVATITFLVPWLGISGAAWSVAGAKALSSLALVPHSTPTNEDRVLRIPVPALLLAVGILLLLSPVTESWIVAWTSTSTYQVFVIVVLAALLSMAFEPAWLHAWFVRAERRVQSITMRTGMSPLRLFAFLALLPVAALPLGRCYFSVPYLFCHVCPRPCVFGVVRPYVMTAALVANLGDQRFCQRACPLGLAQAAAGATSSRRPLRFRRFAWGVRLLVLALVAYLYFGIEPGHGDPEADGLFPWFYLNRYASSPWVLGATALAVIASFSFHRPFCENACPIGATSDLLLRAEKLVGGRPAKDRSS
jgi:spermidine synthase